MEALRLPDLDDLDGLITRDEGERLAHLASLVPAGEAIVEIGAYTGQSSCYLARGAQEGHGAEVHSVDLWDLGGQKHSAKYAQASVLATFHRQTTAAGVAVVPHRCSSVDAASGWTGPKVGMLFVDGMHTYGGVMSDLHAWTPHLAADAWVVWHDYCDRFPGVIRAVDEWAGERDRLHHDRLLAVRR